MKSERMNVVNCVRINWLVFYLFSCLSASLSERWKMRRSKHLSVSTRLLRPVVSYLYVLITIKNCSNLRQIRIFFFFCFVSFFCLFLFIYFLRLITNMFLQSFVEIKKPEFFELPSTVNLKGCFF